MIRRGAGRRKDFITSPETGPLFGKLVANALDKWWKEFKGGWITVQPERSNPYQKELQGFCNNILSNFTQT